MARSQGRRVGKALRLLLFLGKTLFAVRSVTFLCLELLIDMYFFLELGMQTTCGFTWQDMGPIWSSGLFTDCVCEESDGFLGSF